MDLRVLLWGKTLNLHFRIWIKPFLVPLTISQEIYKLCSNILRTSKAVKHVWQPIKDRVLRYRLWTAVLHISRVLKFYFYFTLRCFSREITDIGWRRLAKVSDPQGIWWKTWQTFNAKYVNLGASVYVRFYMVCSSLARNLNILSVQK
jgi:hypothetical protein